MQLLPSVTVELFDYWLRNSFFWEYGFVRPLTLNGSISPEGEIEGGEGGHIGINVYDSGALLGMRVLVTLHKYHARYLLQEKQGKAYKDIGEILIEQLEVDRLRVHVYEAEGSGFAAKFSGWLERVYRGSEPASPQGDIGRPPMDVNDWAYQELQKGRDKKDVQREYVNRRAGDELDNPVKSFREAMRARKYKKDKK
jgi:hypothetical protein